MLKPEHDSSLASLLEGIKVFFDPNAKPKVKRSEEEDLEGEAAVYNPNIEVDEYAVVSATEYQFLEHDLISNSMGRHIIERGLAELNAAAQSLTGEAKVAALNVVKQS